MFPNKLRTSSAKLCRPMQRTGLTEIMPVTLPIYTRTTDPKGPVAVQRRSLHTAPTQPKFSALCKLTIFTAFDIIGTKPCEGGLVRRATILTDTGPRAITRLVEIACDIGPERGPRPSPAVGTIAPETKT